MSDLEKFNIQAVVNAPVEKVWSYWTETEHITQWNNASEDWHTPHAENDLRVGGEFVYRMEEKESGEGFEFGGTYDEVKPFQKIAYTLGDGRQVVANFIEDNNQVKIAQIVEAETARPVEQQQEGWQAILDNFKAYVESH
jgi:uncharacterized protein YndB with AHSA1/START domain